MNTTAKVLSGLLAGCLLALASWLARGPAQAPLPAEAEPEERPLSCEVPEKYRETVRKGLEYLAGQQCQDGHWEGDDGKHPVAMTALAGMALLMQGSNTEEGQYATAISKAAAWLMDNSQDGRGGLIFSEHPSETDRYMYGHGLATQFLAWTYIRGVHMDLQQKPKAVVTSAARYIVNAQSPRGGWYRTARLEGHDLDEVTSTAIQLQALSMARRLDIVPQESVNEAQSYLRSALERCEEGAGPRNNSCSATETAAALACQLNGRDKTGWSAIWKGFKSLESEVPTGRAIQFGRDELCHYYYAQAVFSYSIEVGLAGPTTWKAYRKALFDQLQQSQRKDGSWPAGDGIGVGSTYSTAVWCTILQLDRRLHPLMRQRGQAGFLL